MILDPVLDETLLEVPWLRDLHFLLRRVKPGRDKFPMVFKDTYLQRQVGENKFGGWWVDIIFICTFRIYVHTPWFRYWDMGVSKNNGTPKSSILIGFSIMNHPFWGFSPYFWVDIHILRSFASETCDVLSCQLVGLAEAMACDISRGVVSRKPSGQDVACWEGSEFGILNNLKVSKEVSCLAWYVSNMIFVLQFPRCCSI